MASPLVPCNHIADWYDQQQAAHPCIGNNLLRHGYRQWADGRSTDPANNLYGESEMTSIMDNTATVLPEAPGATAMVSFPVPLSFAVNAVIGAIEGGSKYWIDSFDYGDNPNLPKYSAPAYADEKFWTDGNKLSFAWESATDEGLDAKDIGLDDLTRGLSLMAEKAPRHFGDLIAENDDAETHDVYIQMVLLGEIVFG